MSFMDEVDEEDARRDADLELLAKGIATLQERHEYADSLGNEEGSEYTNNALLAFEDMRDRIRDGKQRQLSEKQRSWVLREAGLSDTLDLFSSGKVPRGREVPTPDVLKSENLPKRPPGRK